MQSLISYGFFLNIFLFFSTVLFCAIYQKKLNLDTKEKWSSIKFSIYFFFFQSTYVFQSF